MSSPLNRDALRPAPAVASSPDRATARERREREGAVVSRHLARTLVDHDVSHGALADLIGRSRSKVQQLTDPEQPDAYSVGDMRLSPSSVAADMARCGLEPHGYEVRKAHAHDTIADDLDHLAEMNVEDAGLTAELLRACGDGAITAAEADSITALLRESIERREALIARLDEAKRNRVSPLRRARAETS